MNRVVIGVGSNIEPEINIEKARQQIAQDHHLMAASRNIKTKPIGYADQPDFLNCAFLVETTFNDLEFEAYLHSVEEKLKRVRTGNKFGPRTIDLDIAVWNNDIVDEDVYKRSFLKESVRELCPDLKIE